MKNLMTRKLVFGVLMVLVLAFGVVGVTDALLLKKLSDTVQSKRPRETFEIKFSVGLKTPTRAYNTQRQFVNSGDSDTTPGVEGTNTIDNQGYIVSYATNGTAYRQTAASSGTLSVAGNTVNTSHLAVDPRPPYGFIAGNDGDPAIKGAVTPPLLVDSNGRVFDSTGKLVYEWTRAGTRYDNNNTPALTTDDTQNVPYVYTLVDKELPNAANSPVSPSNQFDYNDEQITITTIRVPNVNTITLTNKRDGQVVYASASTDAGNGVMTENSVYGKLENNVTLSCMLTTAGEYTIIITDSTDSEDRSKNDNQNFAPIEFTLYVTTDAPITSGDTPSLVVQATNTQYQRVDTAAKIETVSARFLITNVDANTRVRYSVAKGSGTLYVGTPDAEYTTPTPDLAVHKDSDVYLKMNGTTNEVSASVAGSDRRTFAATIVYEYSGSSSVIAPQPRDPTPQPINPSLSLFPPTLSGTAGTTATLTAIVSNQVQGVPVTFTLSTASGTVLSPIPTNSSGQAQTSILLPTSSGGVTASAAGYSPVFASITVTGVAPETSTPDTPTVSEPATIEIYDGDDQEGEVNRRLDEDFVVQVLDRNNNGVSFELVRFRVVEGSGRVSPSTARTDRDGLADVTFTPRSQGTIEVEAYLGDLTPVTFTITTGEPPDAIVLFSGNNQSGRPGAALANPFIVEVIDANDDAVLGVTVTFAVTAGGGTLSTTSTTTNASGRAQTTLTLGDAPGNNTVAARVTGLTGVTFKATSGSQVLVDASQRTCDNRDL